MENELLSTIKNLQIKKQELESLNQQLSQMIYQKEPKISETMINALKEESDKKFNELITLAEKNIVSVNFRDLVEELLRLTGIPIGDMNIEIKLGNPVFYEEEKNFTEQDFKGNTICIEIYGDKSVSIWDLDHQPFRYVIVYPFDIKDLEHCSIGYDEVLKRKVVKIDKRVEDMICHINMSSMFHISDDLPNWHPSNLFIEAIENCILQGKCINDNKLSEQNKMH